MFSKKLVFCGAAAVLFGAGLSGSAVAVKIASTDYVDTEIGRISVDLRKAESTDNKVDTFSEGFKNLGEDVRKLKYPSLNTLIGMGEMFEQAMTEFAVMSDTAGEWVADELVQTVEEPGEKPGSGRIILKSTGKTINDLATKSSVNGKWSNGQLVRVRTDGILESAGLEITEIVTKDNIANMATKSAPWNKDELVQTVLKDPDIPGSEVVLKSTGTKISDLATKAYVDAITDGITSGVGGDLANYVHKTNDTVAAIDTGDIADNDKIPKVSAVENILTNYVNKTNDLATSNSDFNDPDKVTTVRVIKSVLEDYASVDYAEEYVKDYVKDYVEDYVHKTNDTVAAIDTGDIADNNKIPTVGAVETVLANKIPTTLTNGNLITADGSGNLSDSGVAAANILQTTDKATDISGATNDKIPTVGAIETVLANKVDKPTITNNDNLVKADTDGNLSDSGVAAANILQTTDKATNISGATSDKIPTVGAAKDYFATKAGLDTVIGRIPVPTGDCSGAGGLCALVVEGSAYSWKEIVKATQ
jgi:hypothetical protein